MSPSTIGVACLGVTHPHASGRVRYMQQRDDVRLLGAADDDPVVVPFTRAFGLDQRTEDDILADPAVHAVLIHSKSSRMVELSIRALEAGKAVLVEKPGGTSPDDLGKLVATVDRLGGICQVGYCYRFAPSVDLTEEALAACQLGNVMQVRVHGACSLGEAGTSHLNQPDDIGGAFFVIGCHMLDIVLAIFGVPDTVNARIPTFAPRPDVTSREDAAAVVLSYPHRIISIDFFSWDALPWIESWSLEVHGTAGTLRCRPLPTEFEIFVTEPTGNYQPGWNRWHETSFPTPWAAGTTDYSPELAEIANRGFFAREGASFLDATRGTAPVRVTARDAWNVARVIAAAYGSDRQAGAAVTL